MASIKELERERDTRPAPDETPDWDTDETPSVENDLLEAASLLSQAARLLDYLGDVELCKRITKKERATMAEQATRVRTFLHTVEASNAEVEEDF